MLRFGLLILSSNIKFVQILNLLTTTELNQELDIRSDSYIKKYIEYST